MKKWGLTKPRVVLSADFKNGQTWSAYFAVGEDKIHRVHLVNPEMTLKISPTESDRYARISEESFRDRAEPFLFDISLVKTAKVVLGKKTFDLSGKDSGSDHFAKILKNVRDLRVAKFDAGKNLSMNKEISLYSTQGDLILKLQWGTLKRVKIQGEEVSVFEAQSSLYPESFYLLEADINELKLEEKPLDNPGRGGGGAANKLDPQRNGKQDSKQEEK